MDTEPPVTDDARQAPPRPNVLERLTDAWERTDSRSRQRIKVWTSIAVFLLLCTVGFYMTGRGTKQEQEKQTQADIKPMPQLAVEDMRHSVKVDVAGMRTTLDTLRRDNDILRQKVEALEEQQIPVLERQMQTAPALVTSSPDHPQATADRTDPDWLGQPMPRYPPVPGDSASLSEGDPLEALNAPPEMQLVGGIETVKIDLTPPEHKKDPRSVYLPVSFMPATLLTGIEARTVGTGEDSEHPETVILRVQAPAVLPNSLKRNLRGCFVVANTYGRLAQERVELRVASLHCMANNGKAAIAQEEGVRGFVVDEDGKRDLAGIVVSKAGAMLGRAFMAGVIGGLGNSVSISQSTTQTTPLGVTQIFDPQQALKSGLGSGIQSASEQLQNYFMELVRQSSPVIEVGATKSLHVVISRGVHLKILEFDNDETL